MWETILIYVVIPLGIYLLIYLPVLASGKNRPRRYRPGQKWPYEPVWWTANPAGAGGHGQSHGGGSGEDGADTELIRTARGGARGSW